MACESELSSLIDSLSNKTNNEEDATASSRSVSKNDTNQTNTMLSTEFESSNMSSTLFTDITSNLSTSALTETDNEKSRHVTKELILKKQLLHDIQKLKIELSQKNILIDTLKADHLNQLDDFEEQVADVMHEKQLIQAKYETQLRMVRTESEKYIKKLKAELQESVKQQQRFKENNVFMMGQSKDFKMNFVDSVISEEEYFQLKEKDEDHLNPSQYAMIRLYEVVRPLKVENDSLNQRIELITGDLRDREDELIQEKEEHENERKLRAELDVRCQRFQIQIADMQSRLTQRSYKNENFDNVQGERDVLERKIMDLEKTCTIYKTELEGKSLQMDSIRTGMLEQNQNVALLKQDKEYLQSQLNELIPRYKLLEEKHEHTYKQLDDVKHAREELYDKYLNSRDHYKQEYEEKLKRELDQLTSKTNIELDKIKDSSKELYDRENRNLREAKSSAVLEQERLAKSEKDVQMKYNELLGEFRQLQINADNKMSEVKNESKLKCFELDRIQLLYQEALNNVKQMTIQNDTMAKKIETLSKEYYTLKGLSEKRISELDGKTEELSSKLKIYEKLEEELDDVVMQAAELTNEGDSERVLFAYGYGANIPSTAKRRMQQSVQLARRVLQLERANTSLRKEVDNETKKRKQLSNELTQTTTLLSDAQQPYNYLIDSIRTRDEKNQSFKEAIKTLETDLKNTQGENKDLKATNNQLSADLERLLNQREEMNVLKQVVLNMKSNEPQQHAMSSTIKNVYTPYTSQSNTNHDEQTRTRKPLIFTNSDPPSWYTKLKRQNQQNSLSRK